MPSQLLMAPADQKKACQAGTMHILKMYGLKIWWNRETVEKT
jgi:hypothetical protein